MMPPPPSTRAPSGSPFPTQQPHQQQQPPINSYTYATPSLLPPTALRAYPATSALLPAVTLSTHPHLKLPHPLSLTIPPHASLSHHSTTLTLPATHYFLQIALTISKELASGRPYKLFVTVNGTRLTQRDTIGLADTGRRMHVYEGSLAQGVNRVEVEVAAARLGAAGPEERGLDVEKCVVFVNLLR